MKKIVITGGGTGGHVYPALSICDALKSLAEITYVGNEKKIEYQIVPQHGYTFISVPSNPLPLRKIQFPIYFVRLLIQIFQAIKILLKIKPDLVIGVGGFVSVPIILASWLLRKKIVIHEQNIRPGKANRLFVSLGVNVWTTFPETGKYVSSYENVGCPIRSIIGALHNNSELKIKFNIPENARVNLFLGGSGGAAQINQLAVEIIGEGIDNYNVYTILITGKKYYEQVSESIKGLENGVKNFIVIDYATEIAEYYAIADLIICRSGSSTINELLCAGLPSVLIPSPNVSENHQEENAKYMELIGASVMIRESDIYQVSLKTLLNFDAETLAKMKAQCKSHCLGLLAKEKIIESAKRLLNI